MLLSVDSTAVPACLPQNVDTSRYSHTHTVCISLPPSHINKQIRSILLGFLLNPAATQTRQRFRFFPRVPSTVRSTFSGPEPSHAAVPVPVFWTRTTHSEQSLPIYTRDSQPPIYSTTMNGYGLRLKYLSMYLSIYTYTFTYITYTAPHFLTHRGNYKQRARGLRHCSSCTSVSSYISSCANKNRKR